jgi:hypothetical protein
MSHDGALVQVVERRVSGSLFYITGLPAENEVVLHHRVDGWYFMHIRSGDSCGWWGPFESKEEALYQIIKVCRPAARTESQR